MFFKKIITRAFKECGYYKEDTSQRSFEEIRNKSNIHKCGPLESILGSWMKPSIVTLPLYCIAIPVLYIGTSFLDYLNKEFKKQ